MPRSNRVLKDRYVVPTEVVNALKTAFRRSPTPTLAHILARLGEGDNQVAQVLEQRAREGDIDALYDLAHYIRDSTPRLWGLLQDTQLPLEVRREAAATLYVLTQDLVALQPYMEEHPEIALGVIGALLPNDVQGAEWLVEFALTQAPGLGRHVAESINVDIPYPHNIPLLHRLMDIPETAPYAAEYLAETHFLYGEVSQVIPLAQRFPAAVARALDTAAASLRNEWGIQEDILIHPDIIESMRAFLTQEDELDKERLWVVWGLARLGDSLGMEVTLRYYREVAETVGLDPATLSARLSSPRARGTLLSLLPSLHRDTPSHEQVSVLAAAVHFLRPQDLHLLLPYLEQEGEVQEAAEIAIREIVKKI